MRRFHWTRLAFFLLVLPLLLWAPLRGQSRSELREALANLPELRWTDNTVRAKAAFNAGSEKIDPALLAISSAVRSKGLDDLEVTAKEFGVPTEDELVAVTLIAENEAEVSHLRREVLNRGGRVTSIYQNHVFALLPPQQIASLANIDELYSATRPAMFFEDQDQVAASAQPLEDGVLKIKADQLHRAGVRGQGVKVGILDFGFERYSELKQAGYVPEPAASKAFTASGQFEVNTEHGTACSEIVHAMAPDAQLYLAAVDGRPDQIIEAARWLKNQGVDVISFSGGGHGGPHNGSDLLDQLVEDITRDHKTLWVNASGNEADKHWQGDIPGNASGWIPIGNAKAIAISPKVAAISILVNWSDWGQDATHPSATQDIDLVLFHYDKTTGQATELGRSVVKQNGRLPPIEALQGPAIAGDVYLIALHATRINRPVRVHVYSNYPAVMDPFNRAGSVGIPATSRASLAVGAVDVKTGKLESFSSRGPTDDDRPKPDLSSYDDVASAAFGKDGVPGAFFGTSAACPHVSGMAALLKSRQPTLDGAALRAAVLQSISKPEDSDPGYGAGVTDLAGEPGHGGGGGGGAPTSGDIRLPDFFGGKVSAADLDDLQKNRPGNPFEVKVRLGRDGNPPVYHLGDQLRLGFRTGQESKCTLINRNAQGEYTVLPLENDRLEAKKAYVYPGSIHISKPTGSESFLFICAQDRIDLSNWRELRRQGVIAIDVAEYEVIE